MSRLTAKSVAVGLFGIVVVAVVSAGTSMQARQRGTSPPADTATIDALLNAAPGTYLVTGRRAEPAGPELTVPIFVQADAYRQAGGTIRVPVAVGGDVPAAWLLRLRIVRADTAGASGPPGAIEVRATGRPGAVLEIREFALAPGEYDVAAVLAYRAESGGDVAATSRQRVAIPNLSAPAVVASPLVIGSIVTRASQRTTERAFAFGVTALTPAASNRFHQNDRLHVACRIYGWKPDESVKPDLTVEYVFQQRIKDHARFFNKTKPQQLNARTLDRTFDSSNGTVATGMTFPLAPFPAGEFELVVRIKDKQSQASTVQKARFFVEPS